MTRRPSRIWPAVALLSAIAAPALAAPIDFYDADTFRAGLDEPIRIKGWDGPEKGARAMCAQERELNTLATAYARELVEKADEVLVIVRPGEDCAWNRYCGDLLLDGLRYSEIMAAAGYLREWPHKGRKALTEKLDWCENETPTP